MKTLSARAGHEARRERQAGEVEAHHLEVDAEDGQHEADGDNRRIVKKVHHKNLPSQEPSEPIRLIGNPEENFYILGRKQRAQWERLQDFLTPPKGLTKQLQRLGRELRAPPLAPRGPWERWLVAYCEGLEENPRSYLEFLAALEQGPRAGLLPNASVLLRWDPRSQSAEQFVLADWPLAFGEGADRLLVQLSSGQGVLLVTPPGLPFLPLAAMNSAGVSLALQAKFGAGAHEGRPVAELVTEALLEVEDVAQLRKFSKARATQRLWGIVALDSRAQAMVLDVAGPQLDAISINLLETPVLAFTRTPVVRGKEFSLEEPAHFAALARQRRQWLLERPLRPEDGPLLAQLTRSHKLHRAQVPGVSLATAEALVLNPAQRSLEAVVGKAPQFFQGQLQRWEDIFHGDMRRTQLVRESVSAEELREHRIRRHFALAQRARDLHQVTEAFHQLQMGIAQAHGELACLGQWVWAFWQWQEISHHRELQLHYQTLAETQRRVSAPATDNIKFLKLLMEVELGLAATVTPLELTGALRAWSELYLAQPKPQRELWKRALDARLDLQDLTLLPLWTATGPIG